MNRVPYRLTAICMAVSLSFVGGSHLRAGMPAPDATVSFRVGKNGRPLTVPVELNGRTVRFLLDTGAGKTCFDISLKSEVGPRAGTVTLGTPAGLQSTSLYRCPEASIGRLSLQEVETVACVDLKPIRYGTGLEIYGILGADFCIGKVLEIDFDHGSIAFGPPPATELPGCDEAVEVPLRIIAGIPHVRMELPGGTKEWIAIDTGANRTTIRAAVFDDLVRTGAVSSTSSHRVVSVGGTSQSRIGNLAHLKLGTQQIEGTVVDSDSLSLLGLDQLSRFHLRLDLRNNTLRLCKGAAFSKPPPDATSGMSIIQDQGVKIIVGVKHRGPAFDAGIRAGDRLLKVNGRAASSIDMFELRQLLTYGPGKAVTLEIERDHEPVFAQITLAAVSGD